MKRTWVPLVRAIETGSCQPHEFAVAVIAAYDLALSPDEFLRSFRRAATGFYPGALALVRTVALHHRVVTLSNISSIQWAAVQEGLLPHDPFHHHFPSHEIGFHKPDAGSYRTISERLGAGRFVFFDDREENVAAARVAGWEAHQVLGLAETRAVLIREGLLPDTVAAAAQERRPSA